ncbi:hypothetical protein RRG08_059320 [Elysia crispata]|uniref:Uncharacterized protein n=1 Tax=Elysia crispata TaxID=231223 RepID=A0AAE1BE00_9GAST|nr:hypothetical protein RRG08_059320 [Elysia crispata]
MKWRSIAPKATNIVGGRRNRRQMSFVSALEVVSPPQPEMSLASLPEISGVSVYSPSGRDHDSQRRSRCTLRTYIRDCVLVIKGG